MQSYFFVIITRAFWTESNGKYLHVHIAKLEIVNSVASHQNIFLPQTMVVKEKITIDCEKFVKINI